jgi:hypothetical protein
LVDRTKFSGKKLGASNCWILRPECTKIPLRPSIAATIFSGVITPDPRLKGEEQRTGGREGTGSGEGKRSEENKGNKKSEERREGRE